MECCDCLNLAEVSANQYGTMLTLNIRKIFTITSHSIGRWQNICGQLFSNVFVIYLLSQLSVILPIKIDPLTLCLFILCYQNFLVNFALMDLYVSNLSKLRLLSFLLKAVNQFLILWSNIRCD